MTTVANLFDEAYIHECRTEDTEVMAAQNMLQARVNIETLDLLFGRFIPCAVGKTNYKSRIEDATMKEELCTIADEAFTIVVIENSEERWRDIYTKLGEIPVVKKGNRKRKFVSKVRTKYTRGGIKYSEGPETQGSGAQEHNSRFKGWNDEGIARFNELYKFIREDRIRYPAIVPHWRETARIGATMVNKKQKTTSVGVQAIHGLWEDVPAAASTEGGAVEDGGVEGGAVEDCAVEGGAVEDGGVEGGAVEGGAVKDGLDAENGGDDDDKSAKLDDVKSIAV